MRRRDRGRERLPCVPARAPRRLGLHHRTDGGLEVLLVKGAAALQPVPEVHQHAHEAAHDGDGKHEKQDLVKHATPDEGLTYLTIPVALGGARQETQKRPAIQWTTGLCSHGAGYGVRTRDLHLGKVARYQLR